MEDTAMQLAQTGFTSERCRPTWALRGAPSASAERSRLDAAVSALAQPILACATPDDLLDAFDEAVESVEFDQYLAASFDLPEPAAEHPVVSSTEHDRRERVFGVFAERLDVVDGYNRASQRIWEKLLESPALEPLVSADVLRESLRICFGNVASPVVRLALTRGEPLPDWMAEIVADKLLTGVRAFLKLAALRVPEAVPTSLLPQSERLDLDACTKSAVRYAEWLHAS